MTDDYLRSIAIDYVELTSGGGKVLSDPCIHAGRFARRLLELLPPADDGVKADFEWLASQCERQEDKGYWDVPPSGDVWWEVGTISFTCDVVDIDVGEIEVVATNWQVDGEKLPKALWPETRGQFRRLCELCGTSLKEPSLTIPPAMPTGREIAA